LKEKAIIFGSAGQDGIFLQRLCKNRKIDCICLTNNKEGDVRNYHLVSNIIRRENPNYVFNFSAISSAKHELVMDNHEIISTGALNILESVKNFSPKSKVFIVGSGLQFKNNEIPISEEDEFEARDPYSVARIHSTYASRYYRNLGLKIYIGYLFNHDSQFRSLNSVSQKVVQFVKQIESKDNYPLEIGNIDVKKEWGYAEDIASGILDLVAQNDFYEAVIGTGIAYSIEEWLEICFKHYGFNWKDFVKIKSSYTPEYKILVSKPSKMMSIGWKPKVDIERLAHIMINH
jgi:GDPmannose 4,6-dehydratase